ncbi:MAG TPA: peptide deformylase [Lentisphaeria bacterium]|nr:peptide deformylase [Lentisphaeria bacterium]
MLEFLKSARPRRLRIVRNGHPALRQKSSPVKEVTAEVRRLAARMVVTMQENDIVGVGLAAPQVGVNVRLIVVDTCPDEDSLPPAEPLSPGEVSLNPRMPLALVNPEITWVSPETSCCGEGCLSLPGVRGEVTRPARVRLHASTLDGEVIDIECGGLLARCLQHEIDHLDGVLFIDRAPEEQQKTAAPLLKRMEKNELKQLAKR